MDRRSRAYRIIVAFLSCAAVIGCERKPRHDAAKVRPDDPAALAPAEWARRIHGLHQARDYAALAACIVRDRRAETMALIRAVDAVIDANRHLTDVSEKRYSGPAAETWNLASMDNCLGVFSREISIISQSFKGDRATVTLQEGSNVPLVHAEFQLHDGRWLLRPEEMPTALQRELMALARILWELSDLVRCGARVDAFADAFRARAVPQMIRAAGAKDEMSPVAAMGDTSP
jgi:hypothetical protein